MMIKLLAGASLALGCCIAAFNWYSIYASHKSGRNVSPAPFLGALLLCLGLLGFEQTRPYAWVGIVADYGTLILLMALPMLAWEAWTTSNFNLRHRFLADANGRRDDIRLFRRSRFTITTTYDPPVPCNDHGALATAQGRVGTWTETGEGFRLEGYGEGRKLLIRKRDDALVTEEENYPDANGYQHDRLGGLTLQQLK